MEVFKKMWPEAWGVRMENHHVYLKLMIDGMPSKPFSAVMLPPADSEIAEGGN
jgi:hypothetical protein